MGDKQDPKNLIFVIEDDEDIRSMLQQVLEYRGFHVALASNGREALDLLHVGLKPCLVLLDLMMPDMDGIEFRNLQLSEFPEIPAIIMSGGRDLDQQARSLHAEVLEKPIEMQMLLQSIDGMLCKPTGLNQPSQSR